MNWIINLSLIFLMLSCSSVKVTQPPLWATAIQEHCQEGYLCAVGQGRSLQQAQLFAKAELLSFFKVKIDQQTLIEEKSDSKKSTVEVSDRLNQQVDLEMEGVEIERSAQAGSDFYVLARLKKSRIASAIKAELSRLDDEMRAKKAQKSYLSLMKIESLLKERVELENELRLVQNFIPEAPYRSLAIVQEMREIQKKASFEIRIEGTHKEELKSLVSSMLTKMGFSLPEKGGRFVLTFEMSSQQEFLAVKNFVKYKYMFKGTIEDQKSPFKNKLSQEFIMTGLSQEQTRERVLTNISNYLTDELLHFCITD